MLPAMLANARGLVLVVEWSVETSSSTSTCFSVITLDHEKVKEERTSYSSVRKETSCW